MESSSMGEPEVGGQSSDYLFQKSSAIVTVNLPKHSHHLGNAVSSERVESLPAVARPDRGMAPGIDASFSNHPSRVWGTSAMAGIREIPSTVRRWPRASDYFTQSDEVGISESTSEMVQPPECAARQVQNGAVVPSIPERQLPHSVTQALSQPDIGPSARPNTSVPGAGHIEPGFLRGFVSLIADLRSADTPRLPTSLSPALRPAMVTQPAHNPPTQRSTQAVTNLPRGDIHMANNPHDEQLDHLDALEAARIARLAMKDKFEDEAAESSTHPAPPKKCQVSHNEQNNHLDALEAARNARLALKDKYEDETAKRSTHAAPPKNGKVNNNKQPTRHGAQEMTMRPKPKPIPLRPNPTSTHQPAAAGSATPYLLESTLDDKITLYLNGTTNGCTPCRLLHRDKPGSADLRVLGYPNTYPKTVAGVAEIVVEHTADNYQLLVEAYHHLRLRKAELVKEWKRRNPARAHLVVPHRYEVDDPPRSSSGTVLQPLWVVEHEPPEGEEPEPGEIAEIVTVEGDHVPRRLFFVRGRPVQRHFSGWSREATFINVASGEQSTGAKKRSRCIILPETEELYARLAWFVQNVSLKRWNKVKQPQAQPKKRPAGEAHDGQGPSKKAKVSANGSGLARKESEVVKAVEGCAQGPRQTDVMPRDKSVELKQTAVVVLLNDG